MTTFQNRELIRDEIVALFVADDSWQDVFGYFPSVDDFAGRTPMLAVTANGTQQTTESLNQNPTVHRFMISNFVLAFSETDSIDSASAANSLDLLNTTIRQIIRDNAGGGTNFDMMRFDTAFSEIIQFPEIAGKTYVMESLIILVDLIHGAI